MYVTRKLSELRKFPESLSELPEGPNSGFLVIQDYEYDTYSCFGLCKNRTLKDLPFPQNKELTVRYEDYPDKQERYFASEPVFLIPVLNQPLSANQYYAIDPYGKHKGEAFTCSTKDDEETCYYCRRIVDVKPRPLDPQNIYQQIEVVKHPPFLWTPDTYTGRSVAADGISPGIFRKWSWEIITRNPMHFKLDEAQGLDSGLRALVVKPKLSISDKSTIPVLIGKWYSPFVFLKEGTLRYQVERSMYYEVTLEQRWERIFTFHKTKYENQENSVVIDTRLEVKEAFVAGEKATWGEKNEVNGVIWFTSNSSKGGKRSVGLRKELFERMKWEEQRADWFGGEETETKVHRVEEFKGNWEWKEFGLYVLVERFNFKRMDGSLAIAFDFKHLHQMHTIWE